MAPAYTGSGVAWDVCQRAGTRDRHWYRLADALRNALQAKAGSTTVPATEDFTSVAYLAYRLPMLVMNRAGARLAKEAAVLGWGRTR